ncbi:MAG: polysaccharide biosynthesis tyrosine autokinase [Nitrospirae bacterium]|nr:MAG: polysaccharide biosynthesis tyrosine autokinase [Nitrospirota bacterium]
MAQYDLNLVDFWLIVKKRKAIILFTTVLVSVFTTVMPYLVGPEPTFKASSRVRYERSTTATGLLQETVSVSEGSDIATQAEVIRSFPVMERVAKQLGLIAQNLEEQDIDKALDVKSVRQSPEFLSVIYGLQSTIEATQEGTTNIIKIAATADDSKKAERYATLTAEAYRDENIYNRNRQVIEARRFVEGQLQALEVSLRESEQALTSFKEQEGQVFVTEEAREALVQYQQLEAQQEKLLRVKKEVANQLESLKKGGEIGTTSNRVYSDEVEALISTLNKRMVDLTQERNNLLINYTPEHALVKELDRKIKNVKEEMIRELEGKLGTFSERERAIQESIGRYKDRYLSLPQAAIRLSRLERDVLVNSNLYAALKAKHQEFMIKGAERIEEVSIIEPAVEPTRPINAPNLPLNAFLGLLMGAMVGLVAAFLKESFDTSIGTIEEVESYLKVPVLGVIPRVDRKETERAIQQGFKGKLAPETMDLYCHLVSLFDPQSPLAEGYRSLRTNIQFTGLAQGQRVLAFVSAGAQEGKSTSAVNLAIALAQDGKRVLLVDGDLRKPSIHERLGLEQTPGLSEVLLGTVPYTEAIRTVTDLILGKLGVDPVINAPGLDNLNVLPSGRRPENPAEFMNSPRLKELIETVRKEYDVTIFDCPPILPVTDGVTLGSKVDGVVMVYQVGRVGRNALKRAKSLLESAHATLLGIVLSNVSAELTPDYEMYRYRYK